MGLLERIGKLFAGGGASPQGQTRAAPAPAPAHDLGEVVARLRAAVVELSDGTLDPDQLDPDAALLEEAVLDSVSGVQLLVFIEDKIGVNLPDHEVTPERIGSIDALAEWIGDHGRS